MVWVFSWVFFLVCVCLFVLGCVFFFSFSFFVVVFLHAKALLSWFLAGEGFAEQRGKGVSVLLGV